MLAKTHGANPYVYDECIYHKCVNIKLMSKTQKMFLAHQKSYFIIGVVIALRLRETGIIPYCEYKTVDHSGSTQ